MIIGKALLEIIVFINAWALLIIIRIDLMYVVNIYHKKVIVYYDSI